MKISCKNILLLLLLTIGDSVNTQNFIFDLFGVLVHIPLTQKIKYAGIVDALGYILIEQQDITKLQAHFLRMLSRIPLPDKTIKEDDLPAEITAEGLAMPKIMIAWQAGKISYKDVLKTIHDHVDLLHFNKHEKRLLKNASNLAFDLDTRKNSYQLMAQGVQLVERLYAETNAYGVRRHKLYILSNMDCEMMAHLEATYPQFFAMFDGIMYSAAEGYLKPQTQIYRRLLSKFGIDAKNSIMIDDQKENVMAARTLGMEGILCTNHNHVSKILCDHKYLSHYQNDNYQTHYFAACCVLVMLVVSVKHVVY